MPRLLPKTAQEHKLQGHTEVQGIPVAIENRAGSVREGTTEDGHHWRTKMKYPYGYLVGTKGADDEPVDAYVGPDKDAPDAFVVHQHKPDGTGYDEDKVMLGFQTKEEARKAYLEHYDSDKFLGPISRVPVERLQELVESKEKLTKISRAGGSFSSELRKLAYDKSVHSKLMEQTIEHAFGDHITPEAKGVMLDVARESDVGIRHPWKPWNASVHAFPSSTKEEVRENVQDRHEEAISTLARAIADPDIGSTRREILATTGLMGLAQNQHTHLDVHSHIEKPLELARAEGPEKVRELVNTRKVVRENLGSLGGFVTSGIEHVRAGIKWSPLEALLPKSALDDYDPEKYKSDARSLETAKRYGKEIRDSLVAKLQEKYDMGRREAVGEVQKFMGELKPGAVATTAAEALEVARYLGAETKRVWRGGLPGMLRPVLPGVLRKRGT